MSDNTRPCPYCGYKYRTLRDTFRSRASHSCPGGTGRTSLAAVGEFGLGPGPRARRRTPHLSV